MLHGQMSADEKKTVMTDFRAGTTHVLVATTVIEVGIDVPNATVMLIDNADQFGLSQLHQLRGRVGRGSDVSFCILMGDPTNDTAAERIKVMTQTTDGFEIAERDLQLRGPGEFFRNTPARPARIQTSRYHPGNGAPATSQGRRPGTPGS